MSSPTPPPTRTTRINTSRSTTPALPRWHLRSGLYYDCRRTTRRFCGFDVLAHASEPYVSRLDFPPSLGKRCTRSN